VDREFTKDGLSWGRVSVKRGSNGIEVWAKFDPTVEDLIKSACTGGGTYTQPMEALGRQWRGMDPTPEIKVYELERSLDGATYTLSNVCGPIKDNKGRTNLSFLLMEGIGSENGVRFVIGGPVQAEQVSEYGKNVVKDIGRFLREYLVPINIDINILVSQEIGRETRSLRA